MVTEIKLYFITKILFALYSDEQIVKNQLMDIFVNTPFWDNWFERYYQIHDSTEMKIIMMREAGITYRKIQSLLKVAPSTIQRVVQQYELDYDLLSYSEPIAEELIYVENRMQELGIEIW